MVKRLEELSGLLTKIEQELVDCQALPEVTSRLKEISARFASLTSRETLPDPQELRNISMELMDFLAEVEAHPSIFKHQMTLTEFFDRLLERASHVPGLDSEVPGPTAMSERLLINQHISALRDFARAGESKWPYLRSSIRSSWNEVVRRSKGTNLFEEFQGNEELKRTLKVFLGSTD